MYGPASSGGVTVKGWRPGLCRRTWARFDFGRPKPSSCFDGAGADAGDGLVRDRSVVVGAAAARVVVAGFGAAISMCAYGTNTSVPAGSPPWGLDSSTSSALRQVAVGSGAIT